MRTWIELNHTALFHNSTTLAHVIAPSTVAAVIKSNAYGHGLIPMAQALAQHKHISFLCVAHAEEALSIAALSLQKSILTLADSSGFYQDLITQEIHLTMYDKAHLSDIVHAAKACRKRALIHLKIDTGMSRLGLSPHEALEIMGQLPDEMKLVGISTHLHDKDAVDQDYTRHQLARFDALVAQAPAGVVTHALSSGALDYAQSHRYSMARIGTHLYGFWSSEESKQRARKLSPDIALQQVMTWKSSIIHLKRICKGTSVGYGRTFQAPHDMLIAIIPVGYWDGYPRALSNKGCMRIKNTLVPVIGIVSMNLLALDVTQVPDISYQDEVIIYGPGDGTSLDHAAALAGTINIELTTRINPEIPRIIQ